MLLSVIIPIYNEEDYFEENINFHIKHLSILKNNVELILINDGSNDKTQSKINKIRINSKIKIKIKKLNKRSGVGNAIFEGIKISKGKYIFHNSCDLAYRYENFSKILKKLTKYDLVVIERHNRNSNTLWRKLTSIFWSFLVRKILNLPFSDMNFVQFYKKSYIDQIDHISTYPATLSVCLINYFYKKKYNFLKVNAVFHKREFNNSKYGSLNDIIDNFFELISIKINEIKNFKK